MEEFTNMLKSVKKHPFYMGRRKLHVRDLERLDPMMKVVIGNSIRVLEGLTVDPSFEIVDRVRLHVKAKGDAQKLASDAVYSKYRGIRYVFVMKYENGEFNKFYFLADL